MSTRSRDDLDERNTAFEPSLPKMVEHRPGFRDEGARHRNIKGEERFPRKSAEAEVPRESLAARIAQTRKDA
jgi:hypothetical protein